MERRLSNLFRNVPFLTSLEMSLFLLICLLSLGCPPERSPAARLGRSAGGHPQECGLLRSIQPLQLHSLPIALPLGMFPRTCLGLFIRRRRHFISRLST